MLYCPNCNQEFDGKFCPECGTKLVEKPSVTGGVSLNLGDANAISGGVHISHVVHERDKSDDELHKEHLARFKQMCEMVYADGVMTSDEARQLESLRLTLGLQLDEAEAMRDQVRQLRLRHSQVALNPMQRMTLQQVVSLVNSAKYELLRTSFPRLEAMAQKFDVDEVQFYYYFLLSAMEPERCIGLFEGRSSDNYWQHFWTFMAYQTRGELDKSQLILAEMEAWTDRPFGNMSMLAAVSSLDTYWDDISQIDFLEQAHLFVEQGADGYSDFLDDFVQVLIVLTGDDEDSIHNIRQSKAFYFDYVFRSLMEKRKKMRILKLISPMPKIAPLPE